MIRLISIVSFLALICLFEKESTFSNSNNDTVHFSWSEMDQVQTVEASASLIDDSSDDQSNPFLEHRLNRIQWVSLVLFDKAPTRFFRVLYPKQHPRAPPFLYS
ncbi:hypothetical protein [Marinomonas algicola]|uniref:hypothetical protein n=1 Tax=Marinomonas algicola TaxID=2773454 RepID=UPI00174A0DF5|nr:hypothetical protein [Marinomonas algicola]